MKGEIKVLSALALAFALAAQSIPAGGPDNPPSLVTQIPENVPHLEPVYLTSQGFGFKPYDWMVLEEIRDRIVKIQSPDQETNIEIASKKKAENEQLVNKSKATPSVAYNEETDTTQTTIVFGRGNMRYQISVSTKGKSKSARAEDIVNSINFY